MMKPKDEKSLAIAYEVQRRNKKKRMSGMKGIDDAKDEREVAMMAEGGIVDAIRRKRAMDKGEADISKNADEELNYADERNMDAGREEIYDESDALDDLDYDTEKSIGDDIEGDEHDMISKLRSKIRSMRK